MELRTIQRRGRSSAAALVCVIRQPFRDGKGIFLSGEKYTIEGTIKMKRKISLLILCALLTVLCACGGSVSPAGNVSTAKPQGLPAVDPSGAAVSIPETVDSIVVLAPALAETVVALGLGDKVVGYDLNSVGLAGLPGDAPTFDTVDPDMERLTALAPDVLLVSNLSVYDREAPYRPLIDAGVCVICVPTSESIDDIRSDIRFLAAALGAGEAGEALLNEFDSQMEELAAVAAAIPAQERKRVYFEISPAPHMYSTGGGTYLDEMIRWIGGENVLAGQTGWLSVEGETIVAADPDVIFTNANYLDDPVGEILGRAGWAGVTAVANGDVYYIDNRATALPNQNIVTAMRQMAEALYPEYFAE